MAKNVDFINVIDVESTCWEGNPPFMQVSEIIEIGIAVIDVHQKKIVKNESVIVRPEQSRVSEFCTQLTGLTQEDVDKGCHLRDAFFKLRKQYQSAITCWASYGDYDRKMFERECDRKGLKYPFDSFHINVKALIGFHFGVRLGMDSALKRLGMKLEGTHHRGVDDAYNIARILLKMRFDHE